MSAGGTADNTPPTPLSEPRVAAAAEAEAEAEAEGASGSEEALVMRSSGGAGVRRPEGLNLTGNRKLPVRNEVEGLERDAKLGEVGEEVEMDKLRD